LGTVRQHVYGTFVLQASLVACPRAPLALLLSTFPNPGLDDESCSRHSQGLHPARIFICPNIYLPEYLFARIFICHFRPFFPTFLACRNIPPPLSLESQQHSQQTLTLPQSTEFQQHRRQAQHTLTLAPSTELQQQPHPFSESQTGVSFNMPNSPKDSPDVQAAIATPTTTSTSLDFNVPYKVRACIHLP
jgi:hypothetical protein